MSQDILHDIIRQKVAAMNVESYYLRPARISITSNDFEIDLHNVVYILNTKEIPVNRNITLFSSDNVFIIDSEEYAKLSDLKYQIFTDYIQIKTEITDQGIGDAFEPYTLEFIKIIPSRSK